MLCVLSGCGGGAGDPVAPAWSPPAWFAQQAQKQEEYRVALQACLDGKGWDLTVTSLGGVEEGLSKADMQRFPGDLDTCRTSMGLPTQPPPKTDAELRDEYRKDLDVRACLVAQGYAMAEPQSEDAWLDAARESYDPATTEERLREIVMWTPYGDPVIDALPPSNVDELTTVCPQVAF